MSSRDHDRLMSVLGAAMELPRARRMAFLDSTCVGEPKLRREIEELLECAEPASRAFDCAAEEMLTSDPERIGPYTIIEPVGEGGMAIVYKAQQDSPVKRTVALKLIKLGMDTRQFIARFQAERQTLAMMDHPSIAKIHDAGATETGRPYFVMEFVSGRPIFEYCDEHRLSIRERLELFEVVCLAVEHAHRKGIIHRDIKSSNVLITQVDGHAVPKVIDFGIAKAIGQTLSERGLFTEQGQLIGTPEYMSPEQAERGARDVDTRSDVYSLGALLYELIAGVQPISSELLRSGGFEQVQRIIRESEPPRPSTRLSTLASAEAAGIAQRRGTALSTLIRDLHRELEWIPLKAMRKDREQRYRSAAELGDDIRNYREKRPLIAGPESTRYRLGKFLRRHKAGVAASAAIVFLLIAGIATTSWQTVQTRAALAEVQRQKQQVEDASVTVTEVNQFLMDLLKQADPYKNKGQRVTVLDALDAAALRVGKSLKQQPLAEAAIRHVLASTYVQLGRLDLGESQARIAVEIRRERLGPAHRDTLDSICDLGFALKKQGKLAEAEPYYAEAVEGFRRVLGEDNRITLTATSNLAVLQQERGKLREAERTHRSILEKRRRLFGDEHADTLQSLICLGSVLTHQNKLDEAEALYREALGRPRAAAGDDHPDNLKVLHNLANVLYLQGKFAEAEPLYRESLERSRRVLGDEHADTLLSLHAVAKILHAQNKLQEAEAIYLQALEVARRTLGEDHPLSLSFGGNYATLVQDQGKLEDAEARFRDLLARRLRTSGEGTADTLVAQQRLSSVLRLRGNLPEAEKVGRAALEGRERTLGPDHPDTLLSQYSLALVLCDQGRSAEAESLSRTALARATTNPSLGPKHRQTKSIATAFSRALDDLGRQTEAAALRKEFDLPDPATQPTTRPATKPI